MCGGCAFSILAFMTKLYHNFRTASKATKFPADQAEFGRIRGRVLNGKEIYWNAGNNAIGYQGHDFCHELGYLLGQK